MKNPIFQRPVSANLAAAGLLCCASLLLSFKAGAAGGQSLSRHLPAVARNLQPLARMATSDELDLVISLPLRNQQDLTNLLQELYDPASPKYHQFLTPAQFAEQFGPTEADYQAVAAWADARGLKVRETHSNRTLLHVKGSVGDIERALNVSLHLYQHPTESRNFYAPDTDPTLDLSVPVLSISGLDNYQIPKPLSIAKPLSQVPNAKANAGSGPFGTYMGYDFRDAYIPGTSMTGAGQTVALFELDGFFPGDIVQYKNQAGLPNVPVTPILLDGFSGTPGGANVEVALDIEVAIAMAPGLSQVLVYEGFIPLDILNRMATDNLAKQLSSSWDWLPFDPAINQIYQQYAAQGQSMFQASGDSCAYVNGIMPPSDDPFITVVGGTELTTTGPGGTYVSEQVWNVGGGVGSSGGISTTYSIPSYQTGVDMSGNQGSTKQRNIPDVALTADNIFIVADNGIPEVVGGTSAAAPLWAGFTALLNQQALQNGQQPMGFMNPFLYSVAKSPNYHECFHDITVGNNTNFVSTNAFFAVPGYDLCTGWGTPAGTNLLNILVPPVPSPVFELVTNVVFGGNGNGVIDYDECNGLNLVLANIGSLGASSVHVTISTVTPGVAVAQGNASYPNIPIGATATNLSPFRVSTTPTFICGTPIQFTVIVKCDQNTSAFEFTLPTGVPGAPIRFDNSTPVPIPALGQTNSTVVVSNIFSAINKVTVSMYVTATYDPGMTLQLIAPDGTTNTLVSSEVNFGQNFGIACAPDSLRTIFDDSASSINGGVPPFVGTFAPQQPLAVFAGKSGTNVNGNWSLQVNDQFPFNTDAIQCWSLLITPTLCTDGGGECPGADLGLGMTAAPDPVVTGTKLTYTLSVTNNGPSTAKAVSVSQTLPGTVVFLSCTPSQGGFSQSGGVVTANLGQMGPSAVATVTVVVKPTTAGVISSTATAASELPDPNPLNNTATVVTHVTPPTADLALGLTAAPASTVVGSTLTYTVSVTNNGPVTATGVLVTNILPSGVAVTSSSISQGFISAANNFIIGNVGTLAVGGRVTMTIVTTTLSQGTLLDTAGVGGTETDPNLANNSASVATVVGASADLALSFTGSPSAVVTHSNLTYTLLVTNFGPSVASSVVVNGTLPPSVQVLSSNTTLGFVSVSSSNILTATIGTLNQGQGLAITLVAATPLTGSNIVLNATAAVSGAESDPNPANNSGAVSTVVAPPFVSIVPAGVTLTAESGPVNGAVDNGETVSVALRLENVGNVNSANVTGTLLSSTGVTPAPAGQTHSYGVMAPGGVVVVSNIYTFTASGPNGATITATLQLNNGAVNLGTVGFNFTLPSTFTFANTNDITIPSIGAGSPYPSQLVVSGLSGIVGRVTATLSNLSHTYPQDIDALLVGPQGQDTILMSGAGAAFLSGDNVTFDDYAPTPIPDGSGQILSTSYRPATYLPGQNLLAPAPAGPYVAAMSVFNTVNPNGIWSLFVDDHKAGDSGDIAGGWGLAITFITPVNQSADLSVTGVSSPNPCLAGANLTTTYTIANAGPNAAGVVVFTNALPPNVTLVSSSTSQGSLSVLNGNIVVSLGSLAAGATATVTVVMTPNASAVGTLTSVASVAALSGETDLNLANNVLSLPTTVVLPVADVAVTQTASPNPATTGNSLTYTLTVTNSGPGTALNVVVSDALPGGVTNVNVGNLLAGSSAVVTIGLIPQVGGSLTNSVSVATASSDPNLSNNTSTIVVPVVAPAPLIVPGLARLTYESGPTNAAIDPGETVTLMLTLTNVGTASTTPGFTATLLPVGGVSNPSGSGNYGALAPGQSAAQPFTFTAVGSPGSSITNTLQLQDGATSLGSVSFVFMLSGTASFTNTASITIPDHGVAAPYPSVITVSGVSGLVTKATVTLRGFSHTFPHDVNALLVSPSGSSTLFMSHVGGPYSVSNLTLTFDDQASTVLSANTAITTFTNQVSTSGTVTMPPSAPAPGYGAKLGALQWSVPNGDWMLYVYDDSPGDAGSISGGWSLTLTTATTVNPVADLSVTLTSPSSVNLSANVTNTINVADLGPAAATGVVVTNTLPAGAKFVSATPTQGSVSGPSAGILIWNVGSLGSGANSQLSVVYNASTPGTYLNGVTVTGNEQDLNLANNTAQTATSVVNAGPPQLAGSVSGGQFHLVLVGQPGASYQIQASTNFVSWSVLLTTNAALLDGTIHFVDPNVAGFNSRFYRALQVAP